jgi:hypothetical protein
MSEGTGVGRRIDRLRGEEGQALVELAFVLPLVLLLLFGIIDFGLALNAQNSDTNLANLAARAISVMGTSTTSQTCNGTAYSNLLAWTDCVAQQESEAQPKYACLMDASGGSYAAGDPLKIEIQTSFNWFGVIGASGGVVGSATSTIGASATMRIEQPMSSSSVTNPFVTGSTTCTS